MCNRSVKDIVLQLKQDLRVEGKFAEETIMKIESLSVEDTKAVYKIYGLEGDSNCEHLASTLRLINDKDNLVLNIKDCYAMYFRTGHRMYYKEGKVCLACPMQQKISMIEIIDKDDVSYAVNSLMDIVRDDCPRQQFYMEDASRILMFERNIMSCIK